jgi:hypothetical protein
MGLKRKVSVFLFAVMLAVSLGATVVASLAMYRLVSEKQDSARSSSPRWSSA